MEAAGVAPVHVLRLRAEARALLWAQGEIESIPEAVDPLQAFAIASSLVDEIGEDQAQRIIADAFVPYRRRENGEALNEASDWHDHLNGKADELDGDDASFGSTEPAGEQLDPQPGKSRANGADKKQLRLKSARASTYQLAAVKWLWPSRFAIGKLGILAGLPDEGKGQVLADMAARTTRASEWPCGEGFAPLGNVILLTAEDGIEDTVVPRLLAAGADLDRIEIVSMVVVPGNRDRMFNLGTDLELLRQKIAEVGDVKLVLIDPISAYLGTGKIDSFRTTDVRAVLGPLVDLANELGVAFVGIMHFNKKTDVTNALLRISDSLAFGAAARHVYAVIRHSP
jgi:hypothetical protein